MKTVLILFIFFLSVSASSDTAKTLSMRTYKKLTTIETLIQDNKTEETREYINSLLSSLPKEPIDRAYILYTVAMFHIQEEEYVKAKKYFIRAKDEKTLSIKATREVYEILGNLSMHEELYRDASVYFEECLRLNKKASKQVYISLSVAYYYQNMFSKAIPILKEAKIKFKPDHTIYKMLFSSYYETKKIISASKLLEEMIVYWSSKTQYWLQLSSLYIEQDKILKALETIQLAYNKNLLKKEKDFMQYIYLLIEAEIPYKAAILLEKFIESEDVESSKENLELLKQCYIYARETKG